MIKVYKKALKETELKEISKPEIGSWVSVINPKTEEIHDLAKLLNLDLPILEDSLDFHEIPRLQKDGNNIYMIIRFPTRDRDNSSVITLPLLIAITEQNIITVCKAQNEIIDSFLRGNIVFYTTQKTHFLLKIILEVFSDYDLYLHKISRDIKLKKIKIDDLGNKDILFLVQAEETLNDFISSLVPTINILEKILSGRYMPVYESDKDVIEDLVMDSKQTLEFSNVSLKSIKNIREAYSAILTNDLNKTIKLLTSLTIILTVPMVISSIYGMNVKLPFGDSPWAFFYVAIIIMVIWMLLLKIFSKRKWI